MKRSISNARLSRLALATVLGATALAAGAATPADAAAPTSQAATPVKAGKTAKAARSAPTRQEAERFVKDAESRLEALLIKSQRNEWVAENFITDDTQQITAEANEELLKATGELALAARRYNGLTLPADTARKLKLMQLTMMIPDDQERARFTRLATRMTSAYGTAKYCPQQHGDTKPACLALDDLEKIMAESRDPAQLEDAWVGWHAQSRAYKQDYVDYVALSNKGSRAMGFADTGALWRSGYDMTPDAFSADMARVWQQVRPLYESLHTYVRYKLRQTYGPDQVPATGPIPAHLLGNMWSQSWENIYPLVKPAAKAGDYDLSQVLVQRGTSAKEMVKYAEGFYTSLGMETLPETFWERSLLTKPQDREVVCHASAWDIDQQQDVRVKMCIRPTEEDFITIHHELGHIYYDLAYRHQPTLFRNGANDGFHEAIGDTVALSITPDYLKRLGLMKDTDRPGDDIDNLLMQALRKVAFLPFAYKVDAWRWQVYGGQVQPQDYDKVWWSLSETYQGISRPVPMQEGGFDAGAKFHVAADVAYARYFVAHLLQFQFQRALCREAGYTGPLHSCSIFGNKKAGEKYQAMLKLGASKPWPQALQAMTGEQQLDGSALIEYFQPLKVWLDQQNAQLAKSDAVLKR
ncbi:M2 family metallopeptidase [Roseateles depolymerans]|uniref:Peptidyl-dipeptidase n=1 Tax=Roseateles depolymerans TaxID=76731 RepID=A0A0U3MX49_9BURK|nr:M2 family metallopeptidase [Roseateles depolymerans]ALV08954.1 peptidyl-dipeptidase [Roseateles depolymerans]REG10037.1 peptidyl-dipeptidase A [Roseateles depolymerans]